MPLTDAILKEWAMKDLWCESELQEFCCGLEPNRSRPETVQSELNEASEAILRGVLSKELKCIEPDDADRSDRLYGHARFFKPINAIPWASARFPRFPKFSLDLSKTKLTMVDQPHLSSHSKYWAELEKKTLSAVDGFPAWKQKHGKVQKTGNLNDWLRNEIGGEAREVEIIKKTLYDIFPGLL